MRTGIPPALTNQAVLCCAPIPDTHAGGAFRAPDRIAQALRPPEIGRSTLIYQGLHRSRGSVAPRLFIGARLKLEWPAATIAPFKMNL